MSRFRLAHERFRDLLPREAILCTTFLATPSVLRHESDRSSKGASSGMGHPLPVEPGPGPAISTIPPNQSTSDPRAADYLAFVKVASIHIRLRANDFAP